MRNQPDPKAIPTDPDLYTQSLLNAARQYKHELTIAMEEGTDIGKGHTVGMKHIIAIPTPWFLNTKKNEPGATWFEHTAHTSDRIREVMMNDPDLGVPFDTKGSAFGKAKPKGTLEGIYPNDADRLISVVGSELTRMGLGLQVGSLTRGRPTDAEDVLREVRKSIFYASQNYTVNDTTRPVLVNMPFHPLWNKTKVQALEGEPVAVTLFGASKAEQKVAQHLIGPNLSGNDQVQNLLETRIAQICLKAMPHLFTPHNYQLIQYHQQARAQLKKSLEGVDVFTKDLRGETLEQILEMLATHVQCQPAWLERLEIDSLKERKAAGTAAENDEPLDIIASDLQIVIETYLDSIILKHKGGDKTVMKKMSDHLMVPVVRLAMLLDISAQESTQGNEDVRRDILVLVDRLKYMCNAIGGNGYEVAPTMAKMLLHAYGDETPDMLKAYL